jgi:hypothetical protein
MKATLSALIALVALIGGGCIKRYGELPALGPVTSIAVSGTDSSHPISKITSPEVVSAIVAFVDARRRDWGTPWFGVPVGVVTTEFYDGTDFKGSFGVGDNFFTTQREGMFLSLKASPSDTQAFLKLLKSDSESAAERILDGDFDIIKRTDQLPMEIKTAFATLTKQSTFEMADPGHNFQATDVVTTRGLPWRRLIFAGISPQKAFIHYEKGGRGLATYVVVFATGPGEAKFLWGGSLPNTSATLTQLRVRIFAATSLPSGATSF